MSGERVDGVTVDAADGVLQIGLDRPRRKNALSRICMPVTRHGDAGGGTHPFMDDPPTEEPVPVSEPQEEEPMRTTLGAGPPGAETQWISTAVCGEAQR